MKVASGTDYRSLQTIKLQFDQTVYDKLNNYNMMVRGDSLYTIKQLTNGSVFYC